MAKYYFLKLIPPHTSFTNDLAPEEKEIMLRHTKYWESHVQNGSAKFFGSVFDPDGEFEIGIVKATDELHVKTLITNDPANCLMDDYQFYPMENIFSESLHSI